MLFLKQNTLIFRSGAAQIYGILYLLDAFENVCRVCRIALFGFKLRPCGAFLSFINRELAALVSAAHGYDLGFPLAGQLQFQLARKITAHLLDTSTVPKHERKIVAACGDCHGQPCTKVRCRERTVIRCKFHLDLLQDFDRTFCRNVHQCCHRFIKGCCVYGTSHAAFLLVFCKVARILTEPVANVICRTRVSPTVRML